MADFTPSLPYNVPVFLQIPTYETIEGVDVKTFKEISEPLFCSFKTYGGTETTKNDIVTVLDTANVEMIYRPDVKSDCRIRLANEDVKENEVYEIMGKPENINKQNKYLKFKVKRVAGGA